MRKVVMREVAWLVVVDERKELTVTKSCELTRIYSLT